MKRLPDILSKSVFSEIPEESYLKSGKAPLAFLRIPEGKRLKRINVERSLIVCLISGRIRTVYRGARTVLLESGTVYLLPKYAPVFGYSLSDCDLLLCEVPAGFEPQDRPYLSNLISDLPEDFDYRFDTLPVLPVIGEFIRQLRHALEQGIVSEEYLGLKRKEFFLYLKTCFGRAEIAKFMYPLIGSSSMSFKDFIISNYRQYGDVRSFASAANMSESTFSRKFKAVFGTTAHKWLNDRRAEEVYKDIVLTEMNFTEISDKYGFSSPAYLVFYCRKHFGKTPGAIRKEIITVGGEIFIPSDNYL